MVTSTTGWKRDVVRLCELAWPIVLTQVALMMMGTVDYMMVGRAGVAEVGAVMLGNVWKVGTLLVGMGVVFGMAPLVSQAHGAGDGRAAALTLQRGIVLALIMSLPIGLLWAFTEQVLVYFGQEPELASRAGAWLGVQMLSLPFFLVWSAQREYLQGRGIVLPTFFIAVAVNVLNAALNWVLVFGNLGAPALGAIGSGWATCVAQVTLPLLAWAWIARMRLTDGAWVPWSRAALDPAGLGRIFKLGLPVALALMFEMWAFQVMTLWSGHLGAVPLAAHSFVLNMASLTFMVPLGIALAASTRVGNLIGAGQSRDAQRAAWVAFGLTAAVMCAFALAYALLRGTLPRLYTDDLEVARLATGLLPIVAAFQIFDGVQVVGGGILRGMGHTRPAVVIHLVGFYVLGLPLAWWLTFRSGHGLAGLWWGLAVGLCAVALAFVIWIARRGPAHAASLVARTGLGGPGAAG
jgi:multidrug resistance protein, MATE family